jgi:hypothetical protein
MSLERNTVNEVVEADDIREAFIRCLYQYGDEYDEEYIVSSITIEQDEYLPTRWYVWYGLRKKDEMQVNP